MQAAAALFSMPHENVDMAFGLVTIAAAALACLLGALAVDVMGSSVRSAMIFCGEHYCGIFKDFVKTQV